MSDIKSLVKNVCMPIIFELHDDDTEDGNTGYNCFFEKMPGNVFMVGLSAKNEKSTFTFMIKLDQKKVLVLSAIKGIQTKHEYEIDEDGKLHRNDRFDTYDHRQRAIKAMTAYYDRAKKKLCDNNFSKN